MPFRTGWLRRKNICSSSIIVILLQFLEQACDAHLVLDDAEELVDAHALLLHCVAEAECDAVVLQRIVVHGDAVRCADGILTAVALSDGVLLVVLASRRVSA